MFRISHGCLKNRKMEQMMNTIINSKYMRYCTREILQFIFAIVITMILVACCSAVLMHYAIITFGISTTIPVFAASVTLCSSSMTAALFYRFILKPLKNDEQSSSTSSERKEDEWKCDKLIEEFDNINRKYIKFMDLASKNLTDLKPQRLQRKSSGTSAFLDKNENLMELSQKAIKRIDEIKDEDALYQWQGVYNDGVKNSSNLVTDSAKPSVVLNENNTVNEIAARRSRRSSSISGPINVCDQSKRCQRKTKTRSSYSVDDSEVFLKECESPNSTSSPTVTFLASKNKREKSKIKSAAEYDVSPMTQEERTVPSESIISPVQLVTEKFSAKTCSRKVKICSATKCTEIERPFLNSTDSPTENFSKTYHISENSINSVKESKFSPASDSPLNESGSTDKNVGSGSRKMKTRRSSALEIVSENPETPQFPLTSSRSLDSLIKVNRSNRRLKKKFQDLSFIENEDDEYLSPVNSEMSTTKNSRHYIQIPSISEGGESNGSLSAVSPAVTPEVNNSKNGIYNNSIDSPKEKAAEQTGSLPTSSSSQPPAKPRRRKQNNNDKFVEKTKKSNSKTSNHSIEKDQ